MNEPHDLGRRLDEWRALPAETEWLDFKEAKQGFGVDDLGRYVSALANEANLLDRDAGWLVFGVKDKRDASGLRPVVGSAYLASAAQLNDVKRQVAEGSSPSMALPDPIELAHADAAPGTRVLMWRIPPCPRGMPLSWKGHYYGRVGESLGALALHKLEAIRAQSALHDWSAQTVSGDWGLLEPAALERARVLYERRHASHPHVTAALQAWSTRELLHRLRLAVNDRLTRAALVLLGKPESAAFLGGPTPRMTWLLTDHRGAIVTHEHFELPLLLGIDALVRKLRIFEVPLLPARQLAPLNLPNYDDWVLREALHNCIAHQDYLQGGRMRVTESPDSVTFFNLGSFLPGTVERVLRSQQPEQRYRNACMANAMVELDLMETINSGMPKMFRLQRERFFPMPDYEFASAPDSVSVRIHGKTLDEKYVHALMAGTNLSIEEAILLDRVQKGLPIDATHARQLRAQQLVEGRGQRLTISAQVAAATGLEAEYVRVSGLDAEHFKGLVRKLLSMGPQPRPMIDALLLGKLPDSMRSDSARKTYIKDLLQDMREKGEIVNVGKATRGARWALPGR